MFQPICQEGSLARLLSFFLRGRFGVGMCRHEIIMYMKERTTGAVTTPTHDGKANEGSSTCDRDATIRTPSFFNVSIFVIVPRKGFSFPAIVTSSSIVCISTWKNDPQHASLGCVHHGVLCGGMDDDANADGQLIFPKDQVY